ncbi:hypothetical protein HZC35_00275 [Candidatus Saganbacteria bacterium]|nr:hypothetical protein [Candidatus Saganbacteria bacterium]
MNVSSVYRAAGKLPRITRWKPGQNLRFPIDEKGLPGFKKWVSTNPFNPGVHSAFDLMAYEGNDGRVVVGMPPRTPVYAMMDGIVLDILRQGPHGCYSSMDLVHSFCCTENFTSFISVSLIHLIAAKDLTVGMPTPVRKGQLLGTLMGRHRDRMPWDYHLHLAMAVGRGCFDKSGLFSGRIADTNIDPEPILFPREKPQFFSIGVPLNS